MTEDLVTLGDAARQLGLAYPTAYSAFSSGRLPYQRAGSAILVRVADVQAAFKNHKPRGVASPKLRETVKTA